jgi:hypothetical protein
MTDNPLFDNILASGNITKRANPQVMDWTTTDRRSPRCGKSLIAPELKKRLGQKTPDKIAGYSCDMIIIDDVIDKPRPLRTLKQITELQKILDEYNALYEKQVGEAFRLPESAFKASSLFSACELKAELNRQMFDEKLAKTWGRKYD